jgi:hypothetical protein
MSTIQQLASALGRKDETPNLELAAKIAAEKDKQAVKELIDSLELKNKDIQNDAIKVLYETGAIDPELIAPYAPVFLDLLKHTNNRLQWGGMAALEAIVFENPSFIYKSIPSILDAAYAGTVITMDGAVNVFIKLCGIPVFATEAFTLLLELIRKSPVNQLPMYAERAMPVVTEDTKGRFVSILSARLEEIEKDSKRQRVEKVIRKVQKMNK